MKTLSSLAKTKLNLRTPLGIFLITCTLSVLANASICRAQGTNPKECTSQEVGRALDQSDALKDWDAAYQFFKTYSGRCDSGAIAEGVDDSVVRLLGKSWNLFARLAQLAEKDRGFERFVLQHIDETSLPDELKAIERNASSSCPPDQTLLCEHIKAAVSAALSGSIPIIGVLEDVPGQYAGDQNFRAVRVLFQKSGNDWVAFRSDCHDQACLKTLASEYPRRVDWNIAFDGKNLGQITTLAPPGFEAFAYVGLEKIVSPGQIPTIGKRSVKNAGFSEGEAYRPLVAVSQQNYADPDVWKPTNLSSELILNLRKEFRKKFPTASNCANPNENALKPWSYQDADIALGKSYSSVNKWFVAELHLSEWRCDGPTEDGSPFEYQWFVVPPEGPARFFGSGMWLVDAGDYDNDGASELVFATGGYNSGGYEIFYDQFRKHAAFKFSYH